VPKRLKEEARHLKEERLIVTIDGPGGAGKSTVARRLALSIGYSYLDTGAMYRGVAYAYTKEHPDDLEAFLAAVPLRFAFNEAISVFFQETDISERIRTPEISLLASSLSQDRRVRDYLTRMQREIGRNGGIVVEGRDTGSVVFPHAEVKFYLDADISERAKRRHLELAVREQGHDVEKVRNQIEKRDRDDSERDVAPLVRPEGSIYVDTTGMAVEQVVEVLEAHVREEVLSHSRGRTDT
jgi:CMP/dCMP kinase